MAGRRSRPTQRGIAAKGLDGTHLAAGWMPRTSLAVVLRRRQRTREEECRAVRPSHFGEIHQDA